MLKSIVKYFIYFVFFMTCLISFFPKENLYFLLEKKLAPYKVIVSNEKLNEKAFSLLIKDATIYYNDIEFATLQNMSISTYVFLNKINVKNVQVLDDFKNFIPQKIEYINMQYSIMNPTLIDVNSKGEFGEINGVIYLFDRTIKLYLQASPIMKSKYGTILKQMKFEEGRYIYEYKF